MSSKRFPEEFKIEAVKQITGKRYPVVEVASREGVRVDLCQQQTILRTNHYHEDS